MHWKRSLEQAQILGILGKDFNSAIINMFKELKEIMTMMSHQIKNINKDMKIIKKNQIKILEFKSIISKMKNLLKSEI